MPDGLIAFILVIIAAALMLAFSFLKGKQLFSKLALREMPGFLRLRQAIGLSVEEGSRLHVSIGNASLLGPENASALVGLSALTHVMDISMDGDRPPVASSGDGALALLCQDTMRQAYKKRMAEGRYRAYNGRFAGPTPFSYIVGALPISYDERVSAHLLTGNYGPEIAYLINAAEKSNAFVMAASDSLSAQSVLYAGAQEPLIGEELFAMPAYLREEQIYEASLRTQDMLRWGVIFILIIGAGLKWIGLL